MVEQFASIFRIAPHPVFYHVSTDLMNVINTPAHQFDTDGPIRVTIGTAITNPKVLATWKVDTSGTLYLKEEKLNRVIDISNFQPAVLHHVGVQNITPG